MRYRGLQHSQGRWQLCAVLWVAALLVVAPGCKCKPDKADSKVDQIKKNLAHAASGPVGKVPPRPAPQLKQPFTDTLNAALQKPDAAGRARLIRSILAAPANFRTNLLGEDITAVGLSPDKWSTGGEPAGVLVINNSDKPVSYEMQLGCYAPPKTYPVTTTVDDGKQKHKVVFKAIGTLGLTLATVPAKSKRLFIISPDKSWTPGTHDRRKLGVRVMFPVRKLIGQLFKAPNEAQKKKLLKMLWEGKVSDDLIHIGNTALALGLGMGSWTTNGPVVLAVNNTSAQPLRKELTLSCTAPAASLPLTATIHGPKGKQRYVFRKAGQQLAVLPSVASQQSELFFLTTDKTWIAPQDKKMRLGVRVTHSRDFTMRALLKRPNAKRRAKLISDMFDDMVERTQMLGNAVIAVGLSGDGWTVAGEPVGIAVRNDWSVKFPMQLFMSCGAKDKDLPITAIIDDGARKKKVVFKSSIPQIVSLPALPPGGKKLYIITTDKVWTPATHDKRWLGVNIHLTPGALLGDLYEQQVPVADLQILGRGIRLGDPMGKGELGNEYYIGLGLTDDGWTIDGKVAALVVRNEGKTAWRPLINLNVSYRKTDLPMTASIWDGEKKHPVTFTAMPTTSFKLAPILPGKQRTYLLTTDKTFKDPQTQRALGVRVTVLPQSYPSWMPGYKAPSKKKKPAKK